MSTMVDNRWDPILQNQQGPITSGYVSNSDIRQRERKDQIKWERQREYEDLMNKPGEPEQGQQQQPNPPVYYKTGGAGNSLPLGSYEESRKTLDDQRQQEYNRFVTQKKDTENKRREELYRNSQQNYRPPPEPEMYDHGQIAKDLREERQKEYNDYLEPPSKGFTHHEDRKKMLSQERNNEYNEFLEKKREQEIHTRRQMPPTPPGGLNIATEQERKRVEDIKKTMYRDELLKQQKEQLYNRATQQGEVSVINRTSPTQAPPNQISPRGRPPPHPDSGRRRGPPPQNDKMQPMESHRPQEGDLRTGFFDDRRASPLNRDERQHDYQQFLANKQREDEMKHQRLEDQRHAPHLDLSKGDYYDAETYERKRMSLNSERKNDYQNFLSKKTPEQGRREWIDTSGPTGIIAGVDSYNYDKRKNFAEERKKEYKDIMEKKAGVSSTKVEVEEPVQEEEPALERKPTTPINLNAVKIFPVGSGYTRRQRELQAERKKNFKDFAEKKNEIYKKQQENRESFRESLDRDLMESPPIIPIGEYDTKKRQFKQEAHQEMVNFLERQPHGNRDKEFWNKVTKPRILPMSGEYKNRKQKLNDELRKDWRDFVLKQEPPRERIKEFGTPGAVLFTGEYEKTRQKVRDERTKDYHEFIQKHGGHAPRRMPDQAPANSIGFMANLGRDGEREKLNKERQGEYRKFLDEDSWFQQDPPPFHKSPVRDQEPPRDRPASYGRRQTPSYEEILDSKRREEASYRRFEDPEYSRGGGLGGPNDRYD